MSDTIYSRPGEVVYFDLDNAPTGLVGTLALRILKKSDGTVVQARSTADIVETPAGSGHYVAKRTAPTPKDAYTAFWDDGTVTPATTASDDLVVTSSLPLAVGGDLAPNSAEIRLWSKIPFAEKEYPAPEGSDPDPLDVLTARSIEYVIDVTGRDFDTVPDGLRATLQECVQRRVEQLVYGGGEDAAETAGDFDTIKSFGAGSYNETRRDLGEADKAKVVNPWPLLNDLLWRAMTEDKKDDWREKWGVVVPASAITEVDWEAGDYLDGGPGGGLDLPI